MYATNKAMCWVKRVNFITCMFKLHIKCTLSVMPVTTAPSEMKKFPAVNLIMGLNKLPTVTHYWSSDPIFGICILDTA